VNQMVPEIVRIGVANALIKCVTPQRVEYFDEAGQECFVDLDECAKNWVKLRGAHRHGKYRYVAGRGMIQHPHWVEFTNKRHTRLEFWSSEAHGRSCCPSSEFTTVVEHGVESVTVGIADGLDARTTCCFSGEARRLKHLLFEAGWITEDWL